MSRVSFNTLLSLSRRSYSAATAAAAEDLRPQVVSGPAAVMKAAAAESSGSGKEEIFWMRDPKTGYWVPENRFGEVDAVDLRNQRLAKK